MRLHDVEFAVHLKIADGEAHARLYHAVIAQCYAAIESLLGESAVVIVAE